MELEEEEGKYWQVGGGVEEEGEQGGGVGEPGEQGNRGGEREEEDEDVGQPHEFHWAGVAKFVHQDYSHHCCLDCLGHPVLFLEKEKKGNTG